MIEPYIRPAYQKILVDPLARATMSWLTPNAVTLFAGVMGLLIIPVLFLNQPYLAFLLLLASGFCDTLDGTLARMGHTTSPLGTVLDIACDRLVEFSVILGLFLVEPLSRGLPCLMMLGSVLLCVTTFLVVGIVSENWTNKGFHYSPGLIERPEAFIFFGAMFLLPGIFVTLAYLFSALVFLTAFIRVGEFVRSQ